MRAATGCLIAHGKRRDLIQNAGVKKTYFPGHAESFGKLLFRLRPSPLPKKPLSPEPPDPSVRGFRLFVLYMIFSASTKSVSRRVPWYRRGSQPLKTKDNSSPAPGPGTRL